VIRTSYIYRKAMRGLQLEISLKREYLGRRAVIETAIAVHVYNYLSC